MVLYGYRASNIRNLPGETNVKDSLIIHPRPAFSVDDIEGKSLGPVLFGAAMPIPHRKDMKNMIGGIYKRFGRKTPPIKNKRIFRDFVRRWLREYMTPLAPDSDMSFETWLAKTDYPLWRKEELRKANEILVARGPGRWMYTNKMHVKQEFYDEFKWARLINARVDAAKCYFGPSARLIEDQLYSLEYFIKHIPVCDRPKFIHDNLPERSYIYSGDYSAFESHMTKEMMNICEFQLYSYMLRDVENGKTIINHFKQALGGTNYCKNPQVESSVEATRMSGDMVTSLGNGFTNLMCIAFIMYMNDNDDYDCLVEGDDSLITTSKPLSIQDFKEVGLTMKLLDKAESIGEASFCSFVFSDNFENLVNPLEVLAKTGWCITSLKDGGTKVQRELLCAKCNSLMCQAPRCPVINSFIKYLRRMVGDYKPRYNLDWWERQVVDLRYYDQCLEKLNMPIDERDRLLMEKKFNISVSTQLLMEHYFDNKNDLSEIIIPGIYDLIPNDWISNWDMCVSN